MAKRVQLNCRRLPDGRRTTAKVNPREVEKPRGVRIPAEFEIRAVYEAPKLGDEGGTWVLEVPVLKMKAREMSIQRALRRLAARFENLKANAKYHGGG